MRNLTNGHEVLNLVVLQASEQGSLLNGVSEKRIGEDSGHEPVAVWLAPPIHPRVAKGVVPSAPVADTLRLITGADRGGAARSA